MYRYRHIMLTKLVWNLMIPLGGYIKSLVYKPHFLLAFSCATTINPYWYVYVTNMCMPHL